MLCSSMLVHNTRWNLAMMKKKTVWWSQTGGNGVLTPMGAGWMKGDGWPGGHTSPPCSNRKIHTEEMFLSGVVVKCTYSSEMQVTGSSPLQSSSFFIKIRYDMGNAIRISSMNIWIGKRIKKTKKKIQYWKGEWYFVIFSRFSSLNSNSIISVAAWMRVINILLVGYK